MSRLTGRQPKKKSIVTDLVNNQILGCKDTRNLRKDFQARLRPKSVSLEEIVPSQEILSHIFLGFTQDGQHLLSYIIDHEEVTLFLWMFRLGNKLVLKSSHVIFSFNDGGGSHELSSLARDYYDSTAISVFQWPGDNHHLLVFVVPDHPVPDIVHVSAIYYDSRISLKLSSSHTFSVVGWGQRYKFIEAKDKLGLEEVLTPGLVFSNKNHCAFHTGSEIVALSIKKIEDKQRGPFDTEFQLISKELDVESLFGDLIEGGTDDDYVRLLNYELFVVGIQSDKTIQVDSFVFAEVSEPFSSTKSFREFTVQWDADKESHDVTHGQDQGKENLSNPSRLSMVPIVFQDMVHNFNRNKVYSLDNMQFVECQLTLDCIRSPTDCIVIELSHTHLSHMF